MTFYLIPAVLQHWRCRLSCLLLLIVYKNPKNEKLTGSRIFPTFLFWSQELKKNFKKAVLEDQKLRSCRDPEDQLCRRAEPSRMNPAGRLHLCVRGPVDQTRADGGSRATTQKLREPNVEPQTFFSFMKRSVASTVVTFS